MVTIYPKKVKHTTKHSYKEDGGKGDGTQLLYNATNILQYSGYASWGDPTLKRPDNDARTISTPSGTYRRPEEIIVTSWDTKSIPDGAQITSVKVEVKYFTEKYDSYDYPGRFPDTTLTLMNKKGAKIKSDTISGPTSKNKEYSVTFSSLNLSKSALEDTQVSIKMGENQTLAVYHYEYGVECKVKIQYIRMAVTYINPEPKYKISLSAPQWVKKNQSCQYKLSISNSNSNYNKKSTCYITIPSGSKVINGLTKQNGNTYKININGPGDHYFTLSYNSLGTKTVSAHLSPAYSSSKVSNNVAVKEPQIKFDFKPIIQSQTFKTEKTELEFFEEENEVSFFVEVNRDIKLNDGKTEYIDLDTGGLITSWDTNDATYQGNGKWRLKTTNIDNFEKTYQTPFIALNEAGTYNVSARYYNDENPKDETTEKLIKVKSTPLKKEFFKLRLEDGTDVQYNSLSLTQGDDLKNPLTYTDKDYTPIKAEDFIIKGETKRIPVDEAEYLSFSIQLNKENTELTNVLSYIEVTTEDGKDCSDIIVGIDNNGTLFEGNGNKYCLIKKISSSEPTTLKLAVISEEEQNCIIKVRPYNYDLYDTTWTPGKAVFKDLPNVKIHIEGDKNDIGSGDTFTLKYCIENKSDIEGKNVKYKIKEPYGFTIEDISDVQVDYGTDVSFNTNSRILSFTTLPAHSKEYVLSITYKATKKGIYDFVLETLDNPNTTEDDQIKNHCKYQVMVDIISDVTVTTHVSHSQPEINQLIDYVITVKNELKHQNKFAFDISDIGNYSPEHILPHYTIEYVTTDKGVFTPKETLDDPKPDTIGRWELEDIPINSKYKLTLSLRPTETGLHNIQTVFTNPQNNTDRKSGEQIFTNRVKVLNSKKQIEFNVYHAVNDDDIPCEEITEDNLDIICDNDYINLSDSIYYVIEIKNNSRLELSQSVNIYARLPESFLEEEYCSNPKGFVKDENTKLLNYQLESLPGCKNGPVYLYLKVKPSEVGEFVSNFMLSTKTADVLHKTLNLTVDAEFNQRELEHEITIYNFDKTNKYYRYEIDGQGEIFKFFNTGDKTLRPIETESYDVSSIETYTGTNLKKIAQDIKRNSKYVDPVFLRTGSNKLADRGYELYPDGLIRRFGLLKSEVFHYTNQLPITSDLIEKTMRWDVDAWDTKIWAGEDYDNGVFDLTIDYDKIPSNFDIPDAEGLVKNLQAIVDKTKPYGTKGKCYCSATTELNFKIDIDNISTQVEQCIDLALNIDDIYLLTTYNRSDNSLAYFHDAIDFNVDLVLDKIKSEYDNIPTVEDNLSTSIDIGLDSVCVYEASMKKRYINEVTDILNNLYNHNNNTNNIDITIPYQDFNASSLEPQNLNGYQQFNYINNHISNQLIGLSITKGRNIKIDLGYTEEKDFKGFILKLNDETTNTRIVQEEVEEFAVMSQRIDETDNVSIHFWVSINKQEFYHIGFITFTDELISQLNNRGNTTIQTDVTNTSQITFLNKDKAESYTYCYKIENEDDDKIPITFKVSDKFKTKTKQYNAITAQGDRWNNIDNINNEGYASISYNSKVDKECVDKTIEAPILMAKYDDIGLTRLDEVIDIDFRIRAQSNKNLAEDTNINIIPNGDYYYPNTGISRKIYYPNVPTNTERQMMSTYVISQPNVTICGDCLKTELGLLDECPHCKSQNVSHYKETQPVTICDTCGHVTNGTHTYCHNCLSKDVENVDVDYNKTYCYNCETLSNDYYQYCPNCFSSNTIYLDNKKAPYLLEKDNQNIDPILIQTQQTDEINVFNIEIPFGQDSSILKEIDKLNLVLECTNHNNGTYYYCEDCQVAGLGNFDTCPKCGSTNIVNKSIPNSIFEAYLLHNAKTSRIELNNNLLEPNSFQKTIDLLSIAEKIKQDSFNIQFYVHNPNKVIEDNIQTIDALPIDDKYKSIILDSIHNFDFTIDNVYVDYNFVTTANRWGGLENLTGEDHTGIKYTFDNERISEPLIFKNFNIPYDNYSHAYLYLAGICKSVGNYAINLEITDANYTTHTKSIKNINDILFGREVDLVDIVGKNLENIKIAISFEGDIDSVVLTDCNVLTEKESNTLIKKEMTDLSISSRVDGDSIVFESDNMWGLRDTALGYVSGRTLESNLLCYFDFGTLHSSEYIRIYDIDMIVYYQSKTGKITTETIPIYDENKIEQFISGEIDGEIWGFIQEDEEDFNNLEYESIHIDEEGKLSNSIPLNTRIAQSFQYNQTDISQINLEYFGKKGYPSDIIDIYLCDDYNGHANNIIAQNQIKMPNRKEIINIDFDVGELDIGKRYWIILEDNNANETNYHRFNYNTNNIGTLIAGNKATTSQALCFSISYPHKTPYYELPLMWTQNNEMQTIKLNKTIEDSFYNDEEMDSSLIIKVLRKNGNPNQEVRYIIYSDEEKTNSIKNDTIQLTEYRSNIHIDISALEKNKEYYIEIIPTQSDNSNYFVLYYDDENDTFISNANVDTEYTDETTQLTQFSDKDSYFNYKMANILYRYNLKSNTYLSKIIIRNGYNIEC